MEFVVPGESFGICQGPLREARDDRDTSRFAPPGVSPDQDVGIS